MLIGNPMIFRQYHLEKALRLMAQLGYEGIELWPPQIAMCKTDVLRAQLMDYVQSLGLTPVRLNAADADYFMPLQSKHRVDEDKTRILQGLKHDVDVTFALGMKQLLTWEGRTPANATRDDINGWIFDATAAILSEALDYAIGRGVSLSVEVHPFTLGIDIEWMGRLCDRLDANHFGVTYDCCHFGVGLPDRYIAAIRHLAHRIKHVHFSDSDKHSSELHFAPGAGCLDLEGIVRALKAIQFKGTLMLDLWLYPLPEEGSRIGVPYLRRVIQELNIERR
jgi:sugar phosphate isomerase/epimerase